MGSEARCSLTFGKTRAEGKALLETDALIFRGGDIRLSIPYTQVASAVVKDGALRVTFPDGVAVFAVGDVAPKWAQKILSPPSRLDKLGVKRDHTVILVGLDDEAFEAELESRGARLSRRLAGKADIIFYAADSRAALRRLEALQTNLKRDGAIWVIRPKGVDAITESDVMKAGKQAGLVDVKVARFSATHTAEKFVIPVARR
jgi:hypothetical protein